MRTNLTLAFCVLALSIIACNLPSGNSGTYQPIQNTPIPTSPTKPNSVSNVWSPRDHLIRIRVVNGVGEFYNSQTGEKFVPRGMNYIRLGPQTKEDGSFTFGHSLFDPDKYNAGTVEASLQKMHADGYNVIRVFLSPDTMGTVSDGFSAAYMNNIIDFLRLAKQNQIFVMFTQDWLPGGKYGVLLNKDCCTTFTSMNANYLPAAGFNANKVFFQDFAQELIKAGASTEYILSYELRNEMFYDGDQPPLSFTSGKVTTANGKTYDMASTQDKQRMIEENNLYWIDSIRTAILEVDPTALVSVGLFVPHGPNPTRIGDPRLVVSEPVIWKSTLDFVDLHAYPGYDFSLQKHVENFGINGMKEKPIIMGEFGGEISRFSSIFTAAQAFIDWQVQSCKYGFDGWIFWTWDSNEQPDFFNALMQDGAINGVLAPVTRPDPCRP